MAVLAEVRLDVFARLNERDQVVRESGVDGEVLGGMVQNRPGRRLEAAPLLFSAPPEPRLRLLRQIPDRDACHRAFPVAVLTMRAAPPTDRSPGAWRFVVLWYSG